MVKCTLQVIWNYDGGAQKAWGMAHHLANCPTWRKVIVNKGISARTSPILKRRIMNVRVENV